MTDHLDPYVPRKTIASEISERFFLVADRALRNWQEPSTIVISGRACARRSEWFAAAQRRLTDASLRENPDRQAHLVKARASRRANTRAVTGAQE